LAIRTFVKQFRRIESDVKFFLRAKIKSTKYFNNPSWSAFSSSSN